jgi:ATP-dependent Clp protease adapter protein ClpS
MKSSLEKVLELTESAYSIDRYRSWEGVAKTVLNFGYSVEEAAAIMNSKHMRWCADNSKYTYGKAAAKEVKEYILALKNSFDVQELMEN